MHRTVAHHPLTHAQPVPEQRQPLSQPRHSVSSTEVLGCVSTAQQHLSQQCVISTILILKPKPHTSYGDEKQLDPRQNQDKPVSAPAGAPLH